MPPGNRTTRALGFSIVFCMCVMGMAAEVENSELVSARDRQDAGALDKLIAQYQRAAQGTPGSAEAQYRLALAYSYGAEVAMEVHDKRKSEALAEAGMDPAKKAVSENQSNAEYHRLLGELCGQVIPSNPFFGAMKYGQCAGMRSRKRFSWITSLRLLT